jgi:hypothetical protein
MSIIEHLMKSNRSFKGSNPAHREKAIGGRGGGGKSEDEEGESEEGRGEDEEERGVVGLGGVEVGGGRGGGWRGGCNLGLSFGAKPRELSWLSNHSTLQACGEDKGGNSGVVAHSRGWSKEVVQVKAWGSSRVEAQAVSRGKL